jgi:hypothetical protein
MREMRRMSKYIATIQDVIDALENAPRQGSFKDEPEGFRYITMSDTLVKDIIETLRRY